MSLGVLLLVVPLAEGAPTRDFSFAVPAQVGGDISVANATWVFVAVHDAGPMEVRLSTSAQSHEERVTETVVARGDAVEFTGPGERVPWSSSGSVPPFEALVSHVESGPASFALVGTHVQASLRGMEATLVVAKEGECADVLIRTDEGMRHLDARYDLLCPRFTGPFLVFRPVDATASVDLTGVNPSGLEWHNLQSSCQTPACPASSHRDDHSSNGPLWNLTTGQYGFTNLRPGGASQVSAHAPSPRLVAVGGLQVDLLIEGWLRMPKAASSGWCEACQTNGSTVSVSGSVLLGNLSAATDHGRLQGQLGGDLAAAQVDEAVFDPAALLGGLPATGAIAVAAAGVILLAKVLFGALFTRLSGEAALEHPNRRRLVEQISKDPGINFRALVRASGIAAGTARHHLTILVRAGVVAEQGFGATRRFFAGPAGGDWEHKVLLREPGLRRLFDWVAANPGATQMEVLDAMAEVGWSRSTTQHRLLRLGESGALHVRWQGRYKRYWTDPAKAAAASLSQVPASGPGSNAAV